MAQSLWFNMFCHVYYGVDPDYKPRAEKNGIQGPLGAMKNMFPSLISRDQSGELPARNSTTGRILRPDRVGKVAMTSRVSPRLRKIYKELAAQFDTKMELMQLVALRSTIAKFRGLTRAERLTVWEELRNEFLDQTEDDAED